MNHIGHHEFAFLPETSGKRVGTAIMGMGRNVADGDLMSGDFLRQDLFDFAVELRQLAYTMPGGHEDPLIRLSERMIRHASQQHDKDQTRQTD